MNSDRQRLVRDLGALGLREGDCVLLHSSLRSFGRVEGGADAVIDAFLEVLGPGGTLLAPTLTGSEALSPENPPHVDLRTAACWNGRIPETLRQRPGALRSTHPTHSCAALGARAAELLHGHELSPTPCGVTSPYFRNAAAGGYIVLAGCGLDTCTTLHTVEELANVPYHLQEHIAFGSCVDLAGKRVQTPCRLHSYAGPSRDFPVLEPLLLERGLLRTGPAGESQVRVIHAMGLIETALEKMCFDPYYITALRARPATPRP